MENTMTELISWPEFKRKHGFTEAQPMQAKGRVFIPTPVGTVIVGEKTDMNLPLFVGKGAHDAYWMVNSKATAVGGPI